MSKRAYLDYLASIPAVNVHSTTTEALARTSPPPRTMSATPSLPAAKVIHVDTRGAIILSEESPEVRRRRNRCFKLMLSTVRQEIAEGSTSPTTSSPYLT